MTFYHTPVNAVQYYNYHSGHLANQSDIFFCSLFVGSSSHLTLYHTIPTSNDPEKEAFRKQTGKRRKY